MALARSQREWSILIGEYNVCKKKLDSKREALKIMTKEWQTIQRERDIYKSKINQLQQDLDKYIIREKKKPVQKEQHNTTQERKKHAQSTELLNSHTSKDSLTQFVLEYKTINKALKKDFLELKKLYVESQEDVQILRDKMRRNSSSSSIGEESSPTAVMEGKEELILQLEEYKGQVASLGQELKTIRDENSDVSMERDHYKDKCERLNTQLNYILGADDKRLVDIDALVLDNKYLKEKLAQLEEERNIEKESIQKYEAVFEKKKDKLLYRGYIGDRMSSYNTKYRNEHSSKTIDDLRNVANVLSETITEKNLALSHQRNVNRILGKRVSELENKLKTLEVAGLWSLPGHRGYGSITLRTNGQGASLNVQDENGAEPATTTERLEWDDSLSLVEFSDLEKAEILENALLENLDASKKFKKNEDSDTRDLLSRLATGRGVSQDNGCQGDYLRNRILNETQGKKEMSEGKVNGSFQNDIQNSQQSSEMFHDGSSLRETLALRRLSRTLSAPSLLSESFDENDNVDGETSRDFDVK